MATGKWRSIYFRQDMRKIDFFPISSHKTSYTFQLLLISDAMRPGDDSCTDKVKEMYPDQNSSTLKAVIYKTSTKLTYPPNRYSNLFLNACINRQYMLNT